MAKNFPDTAQGARDALAAFSTVKKDRIARAIVEADPHHHNVWRLTLPSGRAFIVYLDEEDFEESSPSRRERREEGL